MRSPRLTGTTLALVAWLVGGTIGALLNPSRPVAVACTVAGMVLLTAGVVLHRSAARRLRWGVRQLPPAGTVWPARPTVRLAAAAALAYGPAAAWRWLGAWWWAVTRIPGDVVRDVPRDLVGEVLEVRRPGTAAVRWWSRYDVERARLGLPPSPGSVDRVERRVDLSWCWP